MKAAIYQLNDQHWEKHPQSSLIQDASANLVMCFGDKAILQQPAAYNRVKEKFPDACITLCSTSGEIYQDAVQDNTLVAAALSFENTRVHCCSLNIKDQPDTFRAAISLAKQLPKEDLAYVMVFSDGNLVNGSELVKGLSSQISSQVPVTGGLAGDAANFQSTLVGLNNHAREGEIVLVGLYGQHISVRHGSKGGWDVFGLEKTITNSSANILVELENQNALDIYKKYLGPETANLPGSALLFPLSVMIPGSDKPVVRTILSVNEEDKTMTFAGDVPVGSRVRFMKANFERITHAAEQAAGFTDTADAPPVFSLLISCVGRKLVLGARTDEEVKAVSRKLGKQSLQAGFYSYGEISPFNEGGNCQLHNQTMTITSFYEN